MFTGIIIDIGTIKDIAELKSGKRVVINCNLDMPAIPLGASIACDGACMTVIEKADNSFTIEISPESLDKTIIGDWHIGAKVNLERPVATDGEFGGHFVTGHVDAIGIVDNFTQIGEFWQLVISYPKDFGIYLAEKGSVTINGVSLTVNSVNRKNKKFTLMIIPHTLEQTNLSELNAGSNINLEADLIARYLLAQKQEQEIA